MVVMKDNLQEMVEVEIHLPSPLQNPQKFNHVHGVQPLSRKESLGHMCRNTGEPW